MMTKVKFDANVAKYLFSPDDPKGRLCMMSWNKLYGACRCGFLTSNHKDSDRFVFRRANSCLNFNDDGTILNEKSGCQESNLIEIAAYAYDNSLKPFERIGTLLKEFNTKLEVEKWYVLKLTFEETRTIYQIYDETNTNLLETQEITHRSCSDYNKGMKQGLYFGGQCPAPQLISVCYDKVV